MQWQVLVIHMAQREWGIGSPVLGALSFKKKERKGRKGVEERREFMLLFLKLTIMFTDTSIKSSQTVHIKFLELNYLF